MSTASLALLQHPMAEAPELASSFAQAQPFRHIVIDDFLDDDFCRALIESFPSFDEQLARSEVGTIGGKAVCEKLPELGEPYRRFDEMIRSAEFLEWTSRVTGIPDLLYDPDYVGGGTHENLHGQELDPHIDFNYHPVTHLHRRLNLILFLNPEWRPEWVGGLELRGDPWTSGQDSESTVVPIANRCVIFETTEHSWHGFQAVDLPEDKRGLSRRSIAVYFYSEERPAGETAPEHSTVYIPRQLPDHIQVGTTLGEEEHYLIRKLLVRRDQQIRFLYDQVHSLMNENNSLAGHVRHRAQRIDELRLEVAGLAAEVSELGARSDRREPAPAPIADEGKVLRKQNRGLREDVARYQRVLAEVEASASFRIGRLLTWPLRVLRGRSA